MSAPTEFVAIAKKHLANRGPSTHVPGLCPRIVDIVQGSGTDPKTGRPPVAATATAEGRTEDRADLIKPNASTYPGKDVVANWHSHVRPENKDNKTQEKRYGPGGGDNEAIDQLGKPHIFIDPDGNATLIERQGGKFVGTPLTIPGTRNN